MNITLDQNVSRIRGLWTAEGYSPLRVSDPEKVRRLFGLPALKQKFNPGESYTLPLSFARERLPLLSVGTRREVGRLISGSRRLWRDTFKNIVVNEGLNRLLGSTLAGETVVTAWYIGLTSSSPTVVAGDTLDIHAGWTEIANYDETNRVLWVDGGVAAQSVTNPSASRFTISATVTIGGAFLASVNPVTGSPATEGFLYAAGAFTAGNKTLNDNDTLDVTATFTAAAA